MASIVLGIIAVAVAKIDKTLWKHSIDRLIVRLDDRRESAAIHAGMVTISKVFRHPRVAILRLH